MKIWTTEEKYRAIQDSDREELEQLHEKIAASPWREDYHIQTVTGLMNDPNGFSWFDGKWHLFYQWFPFGGVHGLKHWYHVTSDDLVTWKNEGLGMKPHLLEDNRGCYSGSGLAEGDTLYLAYTGNNKDIHMQRHPFQMLAKMDREGKIVKSQIPLIYEQENYTEHQRDPKLFSYNGKYYILLGAQTKEQKGVFLLFESEQIEKGWKLLGELKVRGYEDFGFMVECPDIEKVGDKWVLLFSPQGLEPDGDRFRCKYNNVYFVGDMDFENLEFIPDGEFEELDRGFDFYAAQCAYQTKEPDAAYMIAWFGCGDYTTPATDEEGFSGLQTLPRRLTVENGKLMQRPVPAAEKIRGDILFEAKKGSIIRDRMHGLMPRSCVIRLEDPDQESINLNLFSKPRRRGFEIAYDKFKKVLTVDRGDMNQQFNTEFGTDRKIRLANGLRSLEVYVDRSSVELFVNDGEYVISSRMFPEKDENLIRMGGRNIDLTIWTANKTVTDDFVI
ncbi:MAG: sucrose-6-phosphate hydrolase [Solobacterium sp.]|nr:sucrose-6-phosphate hydrolase [Solobacterium sp.]